MAVVQSKRRARHDPDTTKTLILDTVEQLMLSEGYAAVTTRRVAKEAGMTPALIHYYYPTTDDVLVAAYRRTTEANFASLQAALNGDTPLQALWTLQSDQTHMRLATEFMALANHRKVISEEITRYAHKTRRLKAKALSMLVDPAVIDRDICPPVCMTTLMVSVARTLIVERSVGISVGHKETKAFMEWMLQQIAVKPARSARRAGRQVKAGSA